MTISISLQKPKKVRGKRRHPLCKGKGEQEKLNGFGGNAGFKAGPIEKKKKKDGGVKSILSIRGKKGQDWSWKNRNLGAAIL